VFVSNLKAININDGTKKELYIRNSINGEPINEATVFLSNRNSNKIIQLKIHNYKVDLSKYSYSNVYICTDNSFTSLYNYVSSSNNFSVYITTDRPIYRPGQKVNFKGFFLEKSQNKYQSISNKEFEVKVYNPNNSIIYDKKLKTNDFGTIVGSLIINPNAFIGYYTIKFIYGSYHFSGGFYLQAYKKPNFSIKITSDKDYYIYKDKMNYTISLKYFNDQPVVGAKVTVYLYANENDYYYDHSSKLIYYNSFVSNSKGEIDLPVSLNEKINGYCSMDVVAVDETQMEVEKNYSVKVYQGDVSINFDKYYYNVKPNEKFNVGFNVTDLEKNPLSGTAVASFCGKSYKTEVVNGKGNFELITKDIGNYPLIIKFKNCSYKIYIYSYEFDYSNYSPSDTTIFTDNDSYKPGNRIKMAIYSPQNLNGLILIAGEKIYYLKEINERKKSIIESIKLPENIEERSLWAIYIPYKSTGNNYYNHKFNIDLNDKKLNISIKTDKKVYQPKDIVHLYVKSNKDTDIAISVVDKAIYALRKQNDNIFDSIYPKLNYTKTEISFSDKYIPYNLIAKIQSPNIFAKTKKDYEFASFKSKQSIKNNVRKYFPDTALWVPSKILKDGECQIDFKIPDSITSWRIRALGISKDLKVGETATDIISTKRFYVQPILPMFFREGDETKIGATVFNNTGKSTEVEVSFNTSNDIKIQDQSKISFILDAHSSKTFYKDCTISYHSTLSSIEVEAKSTKLYDKVMYKIPVHPYTLDREIYKLMILNSESATYTIPKEEYYNLKLNVYSSFKPVVKRSLERLISYPYGCTEQTMSSFLPAIVSKSYGLKFKDLDNIINKGLSKLFSYQHNDGGWGWWMRDKSLPWMSEYVMNGLYYAKESGYDIPEIIIENGINYLKKYLDGYSVYVLSLYNINVSYQPKNIIDEVYLSYKDKAYIQPLISRLKEKSNYAYLDIKSDNYFTSNVQLNSIFLKALIKWNGNSQTIKKILRYLLYKKDGDFWYDTKDTSFAALALLSYDKSFKIDLKVRKGGKAIKYLKNTSVSATSGTYSFSGSGLVEIYGKYKSVPKESVDSGIKIQRKLFKKIEVIGTDPKGDKNVIDAVLPLNGNVIPTSIKAKKYDKYFIYNGKIFLKYFDELEDYSFEFNNKTFEINEKGLKINGKTLINKKIITLKGNTDKIIITVKDGYYIYDFKVLKFTKVDNIVDADVYKDNIVILTKYTLIIKTSEYSEILQLKDPYRSVSIVNDNIYLSGNNIDEVLSHKIINLYPVSANFIFDIKDDNLVLGGNVKFEGNNETVGPLGLYDVQFKKEGYELKVGDIIMVNIKAESDGGDYIIIEDYFPSAAQVLNKYSEKRFTGSYKLDYLWYTDWDYWYLNKELRDDKIGFFTYSFKENTISYYYRLTTSGKYRILPAQAYTMYKKGIYGQSSPDYIIVH
jgi:uncharacterized protein YfaS (alpha-2-macroglobulin family)